MKYLIILAVIFGLGLSFTPQAEAHNCVHMKKEKKEKKIKKTEGSSSNGDDSVTTEGSSANGDDA